MKVGIIGLGYVGMPLLSELCKNNIECIGFDIDNKKIESLNSCKNYLDNPSNDELKKYFDNHLLQITSDYSKISQVDHIVICVPTPIDKHRKPDLSFVIKSVEGIVEHLSEGTLISLESTTYPGTTREILKPKIEAKGYKVGEDIFLAFSPEREDPGNKDFNLANTPKIVSGYSDLCKKKAMEFYSIICKEVVPVSSLEIAESAKLLENIQRSVNIGLMNEMKLFTDKMGLNIFEIIEAAGTKPFGFSRYYPGPGVGGHCIPIDPFYLTYKAKELNIDTKFIELAGEINRAMPDFVINKVSSLLNSNGQSINGSKILCLGLTYKKNVSDTRESPPLEIYKKLENLGSDVDYSDPFFKDFPKTKLHQSKKKSVEITEENLKKYDAVILLTDHDEFNYELIMKSSKAIIDTKGYYFSNQMDSENIFIS